MTISIDTYRPEHADRFAELNREWLRQYNLLEPSDEAQLVDPETHFLRDGGQIFVALHEGQVVGTCAISPHQQELEIAKLAVSSEFRGQGLARRLVDRCISHARTLRAPRITLLSNSQLQAALKLYESMGFQYRPVPDVTGYDTADVYMVLDLAGDQP
jgi:ribosomal protein S18 acetylase RimI-like enzyme